MKTSPHDRRAFLEKAARAALLGGLGGVAALVALRHQLCTNRDVCRTCNVYAKCDLPKREKRP